MKPVNYENVGAPNRIRSVIGGKRNGDIKIYRPNTKGVLKYIETKSALSFIEFDYMGNKMTWDPEKIKTSIGKERVMHPYLCCDCNAEGVRRYERTVRCRKCQKRRDYQLQKEAKKVVKEARSVTNKEKK